MIFTISTTSFQMASSGKNPSFLKHSSASPGINGKRPDANFSKDEVELIVRMYNLVGERWSIIAGRIPGRNAEEIKEYWMSRCASADCSRVE